MDKLLSDDQDFGKYYKHIMDNVPGAMIVFGVENGMLKVRYVSDNCVNISGFTPQETYERALISPIADAHPDDRELFLERSDKEFGDNLSYTYRIVCKNGKYKWVHLALSKVLENGEILYYGLFSDIDEEHKIEEMAREKEHHDEEELKAMQDMYQSILDETKAMITIIDATTYKVVYANKIAIEMAGNDSEYVGHTCYKRIHHADSPCKGCLLLKEENEKSESKEITYGGRTYRMLKKMFIWNNKPALLEYSEDITERKHLQEVEIDLESEKRANVSNTAFLSRMSHDMRTPMNGILGIAELSKDEDDINVIKNNIEKIYESGKYLLGLINDTLDYQRIQSGKLSLNPEIVDTRVIINNIVDMVKATAEKKGIHFIVNSDNVDVDWYIKMDSMRLKQIFVNLLSNALKFTPPGGTVEFSMNLLKRENMISHDLITIRDTGIGMSEEFLKDGIFKPFSQEYNIVTSQYAGSGLGLSIVKSLVELMDGHIEVESEPGTGTTFRVYLDFLRVDKEEAEKYLHNKQHKEQDFSNVLAGRKILLVEDHPLNAQIAITLLERKNCIVTWMANGLEGVNAFNNSEINEYDAVLMDIRMPVMDGIQAAKNIRKLPRVDAKTIPIIAMTANAFESDIKETVNAGMNEHMTKPINPAEMFKTLANLIK